MMSMYRTVPTPQTEIQFRQNMLRRELVIEFQINISDPRIARTQAPTPRLGKYNRTETLRFCIPFSQLQVVHKVKDDQIKVGLLISIETPPRFFRKLDGVNTHEDKSKLWTENDAWYRQTDIVYKPKLLKSSPLTLRKTQPIIDIGKQAVELYRFPNLIDGQVAGLRIALSLIWLKTTDRDLRKCAMLSETTMLVSKTF